MNSIERRIRPTLSEWNHALSGPVSKKADILLTQLKKHPEYQDNEALGRIETSILAGKLEPFIGAIVGCLTPLASLTKVWSAHPEITANGPDAFLAGLGIVFGSTLAMTAIGLKDGESRILDNEKRLREILADQD